MTFDVDSKFELDAPVIDKYSKKAKIIDAKMNYSPTTYSYKIAYLVEYENLERRWQDENTLKLDEAAIEATSQPSTPSETPATGE
jgi:hypothetical protein